jgi:phosphatidylglycerophosphate synthase
MTKEYEASLKSIETENYLDRLFYRPLGFCIAHALRNTCVTPNFVTIVSIFVGAASGPLFYYNDMTLNILGIISLIIANILDCVDGQLARLTGIKSEIGRILDGIAGDIWFTLIYTFLALRLGRDCPEIPTWLFFIPAVMSGVSHLVQANITDYYKTVHLLFISPEKGAEFSNCYQLIVKYRSMKNGIGKWLFFLYLWYTTLQETATPRLQIMLDAMRFNYGNDIPEDIRLTFRRKSSRLMKQWIDLMTFNGRTIVLFASILLDYPWFYFLYEIAFLNIILFCIAIPKHEKMCKLLT